MACSAREALWGRLLGAAAIVVAALCFSGSAFADGDFEAALKVLAQATDENVTQAVERLGAVNDPRVLAVLQALQSDNLVLSDSGHVFIRNSVGAFVDAASGAPKGGEATRQPVVDNSV